MWLIAFNGLSTLYHSSASEMFFFSFSDNNINIHELAARYGQDIIIQSTTAALDTVGER